MIKNSIITFRTDEDYKLKIENRAKEKGLSLTSFLKESINKNLSNDNLNDSQKELKNFIRNEMDASNKGSNKLLNMKLNKILIGLDTVKIQHDMTLKYFNIPQTKEELLSHINEHPITEVAEEKAIKNIRDIYSKRSEEKIIDE